MDNIEAGKANGLLVWHANRLARNASDGGRIITAMDEGWLLEVRTTSGRTYYNTPEDKFFLQLEFGMAKKSPSFKASFHSPCTTSLRILKGRGYG